ncbi:MAG: glycosyltransferase [Phycisphaerales bacterium]
MTMRILMLGWEFPPFIAGGLGTACYGLTKALDRLGHEITFVLPKAVDRSHSSHVELLSPEALDERATHEGAVVSSSGGVRRDRRSREVVESYQVDEFEHVTFQAVPSGTGLSSPYGDAAPLTPEEIEELRLRQREEERRKTEVEEALIETADRPTPGFLGLGRPTMGGDYAGDMLTDIRRYAALCLELTRSMKFDVIHAHDWMTYPAGMAIARATGVPLVAHIHSTEFDRSGESVNSQIYEIERRGLHSALRVISVSFWTKKIVCRRYGVDPSRVHVVWNGVDLPSGANGLEPIASTDKIVLFLGRITMQKGPEYFVAAAKRVLEKISNVKFIVAGSGDMATRIIELAAKMGIGHKVLFTGFLRGKDVERVYQMADCYVMPSVSEPFGIAPLEAMSHDVPVIISKQSGVSEVLTHALKVDFWDVDEMANKIIAVLRHPPLSQTLRYHGQFEIRRLTWEGAAEGCVRVYEEARQALRSSSPRISG